MSILVEPIGSPGDLIFTDQDLLHIWLEFPESGHDTAYFTNDQQTIVCIPSVLNPAIQWCSTKDPATNPWALLGPPPETGTGIVVPPTPPPSHMPPMVGTPEPNLTWILIVAIWAITIWNNVQAWRKPR